MTLISPCLKLDTTPILRMMRRLAPQPKGQPAEWRAGVCRDESDLIPVICCVGVEVGAFDSPLPPL